MIITYIQARPNGEVISSGVIQEELLHTVQPIENARVVAGLHTDPSALVYFDGTSLVAMPNKPSADHVFDYDTKQWKYDIEGAKKKALAKRDQLLAEGPDRISPLWWNSMTPQQQQEWEYYRQSLLDITGQADYPEFIVWPIKP